jgi:chemotaxis protein MotB
MSRRKSHEEHVNHEAWAIPYGDLITLLLAFFVVMYALSSVNEGKYRVLSDSLVAAFRSPPKSLEPIQIGEVSRARDSAEVQQQRTLVPLEIDKSLAEAAGLMERSAEYEQMREMGMSPEQIDQTVAEISNLSKLIGNELEALVAADQVKLRENSFWLEIEINTSVLFPVASAHLADSSVPIVRRIGEILAPTDSRVQVEGHTDNVPISTQEFPSNWELSAARAASVVRIFKDAGVDPSKMAALGYAEFQPAGDNDTVEGRAANRRVVVVVTANSEAIADDRLRPPASRGE